MDSPLPSKDRVAELQHQWASRVGSQKGQYRMKHADAGMLFTVIDDLRRELAESRDSERLLCGQIDRLTDEADSAHEPPADPLKRISEAAQDEAAINQLFDMWFKAQQSPASAFQTYCAGYGAGLVRGAYGMAQPAPPPSPDDGRDAARYRHIRTSRLLPDVLGHELDAAVDAAIAACSTATKGDSRG